MLLTSLSQTCFLICSCFDIPPVSVSYIKQVRQEFLSSWPEFPPPTHARLNFGSAASGAANLNHLRVSIQMMHSKQCCSHCGCLAQLAAVLRPCFAGLSSVTCSEKVVLKVIFFPWKWILGWNNHVILWWLITVKGEGEKKAHVRVPADTLPHTHTHTPSTGTGSG